MLNANRAGLTCILALTACAKSQPDFQWESRSPMGTHVAYVNGFEPRGTLSGKLTVSFATEDSAQKSFVFTHIREAYFGWISKDTFAVIAEKMTFFGLDSQYFPNGTVDNSIKVVLCAKELTDCSSLQNQMSQQSKIRHITSFPEG